MKQPETKGRSNQVWLLARASLRATLISNIAASHDFRLVMAKPLMLPMNPISCKFYSGINALWLTHVTYRDYLKTRVFDPRFCSFREIEEQGIIVRRGAKAHPALMVFKYIHVEKLNEQTGEIEACFKRLKAPFRSYHHLFHVSDFSERPVPTQSTVLAKLRHPLANNDEIDDLVGAIVQANPVDIVFHRQPNISRYCYESHRIDISEPLQFSNLQDYFEEIVSLLVGSCRRKYLWGDSLDPLVRMLGSHMLWSYLLLPSKIGRSEERAICCVNEVSENEALMMAVLYADQVAIHLLESTSQSLVVKQYRQTLAAYMKMDFLMFTQHDLGQIENHAGGTLQKSEENYVTF